ncbi:MAG TPA: hypothetical protein PLA46_04810, partial [Phycicoccus sp.]|nr:hypothetical protein [Phycicoccus sp.]
MPPRLTRPQRAVVAAALAERHGGVVHRADLRAEGVTREDVRTEVRAGRWSMAGRHTVVIGGSTPQGEGLLWRAVWESGSGAVLDGASSLLASGLTGFTTDRIWVCVPRSSRAYPVEGVVLTRRRVVTPAPRGGVPRTDVDVATIRAAQWAVSDRQAALLVCLPIQQRLTAPMRLLEAWRLVRRSRRRSVLDQVIRDVCDGAHSLGDLDFAVMCRRRGLPEPRRQVLVEQSGRVYLDVEFDGGLVVEIDGGHHARALAPVDDALRQNSLTLTRRLVLRIPVLGLRLQQDAFMDQIAEG